MKKYKKQELFKNIGLVIFAFLIGFGVSNYGNNFNSNFLKADITNSTIKIKNSSILEKENVEKKDFYIQKDKDNIYDVILSKEIKNPLNIGLTFTFDKNKIDIESIESLTEKFDIIELKKANGIIIVSIIPKEKIEKFSGKIIKLKIKNNTKLGDFSFINIINANYFDGKETYNITTSGTNVF